MVPEETTSAHPLSQNEGNCAAFSIYLGVSADDVFVKEEVCVL